MFLVPNNEMFFNCILLTHGTGKESFPQRLALGFSNINCSYMTTAKPKGEYVCMMYVQLSMFLS